MITSNKQRHMRIPTLTLFISILLLIPLSLMAQNEGASGDKEDAPAAGTPTAPESGEAEEKPAETSDNETKTDTTKQSTPVDDSDSEVAALKAELAEMKAQMAADKEQTESRFSDMEIQMLEAGGGGQEAKDRLNIYGFFDLTFMKMMPDEDSALNGLAWDKPSFMIPNLNIYFKSQMTDSLSALVELRFTFFPHGNETGLMPYERVDTTVKNPYSSEELRLGGLIIERVHLTWQPFNFFGITAGYFLTPYGIWNIDHGAPTLLTITMPTLQWQEYIPAHQLGLQVFGRFNPVADLFLDYAVTLSNGRGPLDTVYDLDANKGLGLRLKLTYEGEKVSAVLGGYGYWGDYTDVSKAIVNTDPFEVKQSKEVTYEEFGGALDFSLGFYGVILELEYVRTLKLYGKRELRSQTHGLGGYLPDHVTDAMYTVLGYTLPLEKWLNDMTLTLYYGFEYTMSDDTRKESSKMYAMKGGLNFKPSAYVTLKAEAMRMETIDSPFLDAWRFTGQMAVSF